MACQISVGGSLRRSTIKRTQTPNIKDIRTSFYCFVLFLFACGSPLSKSKISSTLRRDPPAAPGALDGQWLLAFELLLELRAAQGLLGAPKTWAFSLKWPSQHDPWAHMPITWGSAMGGQLIGIYYGSPMERLGLFHLLDQLSLELEA